MSDDSERHPMRVLLLVLLLALVGILAYGVVRFDWLQRPDNAVETVAVWTEPPLEEEATLDVEELPATTTIPETLEDAVVTIDVQEPAETEAESVEPLRPSAESQLEVLELAWAEQQVVPAVRDQAMQMILGIVERHHRVVAVDRVGAGSGRCDVLRGAARTLRGRPGVCAEARRSDGEGLVHPRRAAPRGRLLQPVGRVGDRAARTRPPV